MLVEFGEDGHMMVAGECDVALAGGALGDGFDFKGFLNANALDGNGFAVPGSEQRPVLDAFFGIAL